MNVRIAAVVFGLAVAAPGVAAVAGAQVAGSFHDLRSSLHGGERLMITDLAGTVMSGRLIELSDRSLRLLQSAGPIEMLESSIVRVDRVTSRARRGALVGLIGGAAAGALAVALAPPCQRFCVGPSKAAAILPAAGIFGGIGAGIGALIGSRMSGRRVIYLTPATIPTGLDSSEKRERAVH
jgi:hypothetical protein